ncbi:MAG: hypothetical protein EI684_04570 [Candidatus Viridilinea halotolerans]|uniref:Uncharacterized protein n=1 Tax=Candidatus Viridilinea halotolerans TaxID=2491704 RepID=A0A426U678_9CHLR|nr:MAG: hypothetical protein EI684_04570 [Candidatus Viridilinea halotolerans]
MPDFPPDHGTPLPPQTVVQPFPLDPRLAPLVATLTDDQAAHVLALMNGAFSPDEALDALLGTPDENRSLLLSTMALNMAMGGEAEFSLCEAFVAQSRLAFPASATHDA